MKVTERFRSIVLKQHHALSQTAKEAILVLVTVVVETCRGQCIVCNARKRVGGICYRIREVGRSLAPVVSQVKDAPSTDHTVNVTVNVHIEASREGEGVPDGDAVEWVVTRTHFGKYWGPCVACVLKYCDFCNAGVHISDEAVFVAITIDIETEWRYLPRKRDAIQRVRSPSPLCEVGKVGSACVLKIGDFTGRITHHTVNERVVVQINTVRRCSVSNVNAVKRIWNVTTKRFVKDGLSSRAFIVVGLKSTTCPIRVRDRVRVEYDI